MPASLAAPPIQTPLADSPRELLITKVWANWLRSLIDRAEVAAYEVKTVQLTGQTASIGLTSLIALASGLYRVSYRFRVTTAATTSSSLQVTITTTDGGITVTQSSAAYTGNATNAPQSGVFIVQVDASSPLQYSTTYASSGATAMAYALDLIVEVL